MMKRWLIMALCLSACAPQTPPTHVRAWRGYPVTEVSHLALGHGVHANLLPAHGKMVDGMVYVSGAYPMDVSMSKGVLSVHCEQCPTASAVNVKVQLPVLRGLTLEDDASADLMRIHTKRLQVTHLGSGALRFRGGAYDVNELDLMGPGRIEGYWMAAPRLHLDVEQGQVTLAGDAKRVVANVSGQAHVDLHQMRAQHVWLKTQDQAHVVLTALRSLQVLAKNDSHVIYKKYLPDARTQIYAQDHATVLHVR